MNAERDEYFSPQDADREQFDAEWEQWNEELEETLEDYLTALCSYYGNHREQA